MVSASEESFMTDMKEIFAPKHSALIIVDMQKDFCDTDGLFAQAGRDISSVRDIIPNIQKVLNCACQCGVFIVYMQQITLPGGRSDDVRSVLITGTTTEGCVMATLLDASFHDYYTGVVSDGVASSVNKMQETALAFMKTRYKILTSDEVISLWL